MELSNVGMRQHYLIGTQVRKTYIDKHQLISPLFNSSEILFYSTDRTRTLESGMSQISGLFPPSACQQTLTEWQQKNALPPVPVEDIQELLKELGEKALPDCFNLFPIYSEKNEHSYDIQCQDSDCRAYQDVSSQLCSSKEQRELQQPFIDFLTPAFQKHIGPVTAGDVGSICSYLVLAEVHTFDLKFNWWQNGNSQTLSSNFKDDAEVYQQIMDNCKALDNAGLYCKSWGDERLWKVGAKRYLDKLVNSMDKVISGETTYKMELNFSHDTSTAIILAGLGYLTKVNPPLASTLFVELHEEGKKFCLAMICIYQIQHR